MDTKFNKVQYYEMNSFIKETHVLGQYAPLCVVIVRVIPYWTD